METNSHVMLLGICLVWLLLEDKSVMFSKVGHSSTVVFSSIYPEEIPVYICIYTHTLKEPYPKMFLLSLFIIVENESNLNTY